jgi:hypothetical protein
MEDEMDPQAINTSKLDAFAARARAAGRILYGDVCRLQRDVLPDGITSREEVRILLDLDRAIPRKDLSFSEFLVTSIVSFVVWGERPTGRVEAGTAEWLLSCICGEKITRTGVAIAAEIVAEAADGAAPFVAVLEGRPLPASFPIQTAPDAQAAA